MGLVQVWSHFAAQKAAKQGEVPSKRGQTTAKQGQELVDDRTKCTVVVRGLGLSLLAVATVRLQAL